MSRTAPQRFVLVALVLPIALAVVGIAIQLATMPSLPDPVAVHWGPSGRPDRFGSPWTSPILTLVIAVGLPVVFAAIVLPGLRRGERGFAQRLLGAHALGLGALGAILPTWTLVMQAGMTDAAGAPSVAVPLTLSLAAAVVAGIAGWFLQPRSDPALRTTEQTRRVALSAGERAVWLRTTSVGTGAAATLIGATLMLAGATLVAGLTAGGQVFGILALVTVILIATIATTVSFHVRVDERGLMVTSALGVPRWLIPLTDIESAAAVTVSPLAEFGGWGIRLVPGRLGIVLRTGPAIEVRRRGGKTFVVTVEDAETAAALLEALVARSAAGTG